MTCFRQHHGQFGNAFAMAAGIRGFVVDGGVDRPPSLAGVADHTGVGAQLRVGVERLGGEVEPIAADLDS